MTRSACQGLCERGPIAFVYPDGVLYQKLTPEKVAKIVEKHLKDGQPVAEYAWSGKRLANRFLPIFGDVQFFGKQLRLTLRNCGVIDPGEPRRVPRRRRATRRSAKVLTEMTPEAGGRRVIKSGLRGRGGGGFPTGREVAARGRRRRATRSTSSATRTRATPARSWTAARSRATRTRSSRA